MSHFRTPYAHHDVLAGRIPRGGRCGVLVELVLVGEGVKGAADKLLFCAASCEGAFPGGAGLVNFYICHSSDLFGRGGGGERSVHQMVGGPWPRAPGVRPQPHKARPGPEPQAFLRNARRSEARAAPLPLPGLVARLAVRLIAPRRCFILCAARALRRRLPACIARTQIFPRVGRRCLSRVAACCCLRRLGAAQDVVTSYAESFAVASPAFPRQPMRTHLMCSATCPT